MSNLNAELIRKVNDLTTIVNSIITNAKYTGELPDAALPLSDADLVKIVQGGIDTKTSLVNVGGNGNALDRMRWKNLWVNAAYKQWDVVVDGSWTMVANKDTTERAAPQPIGSKNYIYGDTIGSATNTEKQIIYGQSYTNPDQAVLITGYRVWTVLGQSYSIFSVTGRGTPDQIITQQVVFTANTNGWLDVGIKEIIIQQNSAFDLIVIVNEGDPIEVETLANYDYETPGGGGQEPEANGEMMHNNNDKGNLLIHKFDDNDVDRSTMLSNLSPGDSISDGSVDWSVQGNAIDSGEYFTVAVLPEIQSSDGTKEFTFSSTQASPIEYGYDEDEWVGSLIVRGLFDPSILPGTNLSALTIDELVENDNQYGIDLQVQEVSISEDWDWLNPGASTAGGSPGATDPITIVDNLDSTDADVALSGNMGRELNVNKSDKDHTHPNPFGTVEETAVNYDTNSKNDKSSVSLTFNPGSSKLTLDSTGLTPGWYQQAINNTGGVLVVDKAPTDLVIGLLPGSVPNTQMVFYQLLKAGVWVVAYGDEVAAHSLTDHINVNVPEFPMPNARLAFDFFNGLWEEHESIAGLGIMEFAYQLQLPASITPVAGFVSRSSDNPVATIRLYFNSDDAGGFNKDKLLVEVKTGDIISFVNKANDSDTESYVATAAIFHNSVDNVWILDVEHVSSTGTVLSDNAELNVKWRIVQEEVKQVAIVLQQDVTDTNPGYVTAVRDQSKMGPIGINALDLSWSDGTYPAAGAGGESAFAQGLNILANGWGATGFGYLVKSNGTLSFAQGYLNETVGYGAFIGGYDNYSNGSYSFTHGVSNQNTIERGFMVGRGLVGGAGLVGTAIIGTCNIEPGADNAALIIGNGTVEDGAGNTVTRLVPGNAFVVYKSGLIEASGGVTLKEQIFIIGSGVGNSNIAKIDLFDSNKLLRGAFGFTSDENQHITIESHVSGKTLTLLAGGILEYDGRLRIGADPTEDAMVGSLGFNDLRYALKNPSLNSNAGFDDGSTDWQLTGQYVVANNRLECGLAQVGSGTATHSTFVPVPLEHYMVEVIMTDYVEGFVAFRLNGITSEWVGGNGKWLVPIQAGTDTIVYPGLQMGNYGNQALVGICEIVSITRDATNAGYEQARKRASHSGSQSIVPDARNTTHLLHDNNPSTITLEADPTYTSDRTKTARFINNRPGVVTFEAGGGMTIRSLNNNVDTPEYGVVNAEWISATEVNISGDLV